MTEMLIRCPRLGHEVPFSYCRQESSPFPCERITSCWGELLPVEHIIHEGMDVETWMAFMNHRPQHKISTLVDLIAQARVRREQGK